MVRMDIWRDQTRYVLYHSNHDILTLHMRLAHHDNKEPAIDLWGSPINEDIVEKVHSSKSSLLTIKGLTLIQEIIAVATEILNNKDKYRNSVKDYKKPK